MKHFVIVFDRSTGKVDVREFPGSARHEALAERFRLEQEHAADPTIEVVSLTAPSVEVLKRTHERYFRTTTEMERDLFEAAGG